MKLDKPEKNIKIIMEEENILPIIKYSTSESAVDIQILNDNCFKKLSILEFWEDIKRRSMKHLLEEVIKVQAMEKKLNRLEKQKLEGKILSQDDDERSEENDTKDLHAAQETVESLTKTTFDSEPKCEDIYQIMRNFVEPIIHNNNLEAPKWNKSQQPMVYMLGQSNSIKRRRSCGAQVETRNKVDKSNKRPQLTTDDGVSEKIVIGSNGTTVSRKAWNTINWTLSGPAITRKILMEVFDRGTLAFHTLTGKPSPAFIDYDMPKKNQLDPQKVADIIELMTTYFGMTSREVRSAITTKCADENKMHRQRQQKEPTK